MKTHEEVIVSTIGIEDRDVPCPSNCGEIFPRSALPKVCPKCGNTEILPSFIKSFLKSVYVMKIGNDITIFPRSAGFPEFPEGAEFLRGSAPWETE